jgi:hypothetical protein
MACNICGNTKSSPCACQDHGLTTPCSYVDCTTYAGQAHPEHCSEIQCIDCVAHCRNNFQAPNASGQYIYAYEGDKLDTILQRMFIFATAPSCYTLAIPHIWTKDPGDTTTTTVKLYWDSVPSTVTSVNVQFALLNSNVWTTDNTTPLANTVFEWTVGTTNPLIPATAYKFRLASTDDTSTCHSVELLITTAMS